MSHTHRRKQLHSYGRVHSVHCPGIGLVFAQSHYSARVAAALAWLRRELRIGGKWGVRAEGGWVS